MKDFRRKPLVKGDEAVRAIRRFCCKPPVYSEQWGGEAASVQSTVKDFRRNTLVKGDEAVRAIRRFCCKPLAKADEALQNDD